MIYFDTNIYLYAFCENIDDEKQQTISIKLIEEALKNKEIITSEIILYEYAFVAKKLGESQEDIEKYLQFLKRFIKPSFDVYERTLEIMQTKESYKSSFDTFHLAFAEHHKCKKLITFDKGFKKLKDVTIVEIVIC